MIMGSKCMWCIFAVLSLWICVAGGSYTEEISRISAQCCLVGSSYARSHTQRDCKSAVPAPVPPAFGELCTLLVNQCCFQYFDKKKDCDNGVDIAQRSRDCDSTTTDTSKSCCNECLKGISTGERGDKCTSLDLESDEEFLASDAFGKCCQNASLHSSNHESSDSLSGKPVVLSTDVASVCEEYAPNELCAHHCIPVPGSYRCECNPGFKLMADGKNCIEVVKNRCKPRSPCQHKCNDNGVEVKCSCRRGYQLQADGKSCKDIDECALETPVCSDDMQCRNTHGSYKCIPKRKSSIDRGKCPPGFNKNRATDVCDDINECTLPSPPCPPYLCENTIGGYKCGGTPGDPHNFNLHPIPVIHEDRCPPGFRSGRNEECEDVDECKTNKHDCNAQSQFCINTRGSFHCQDRASRHCPPGFKINSDTNKCEDIDECSESQYLCPSDRVCVNVPGAYDCKLKPTANPGACPEGMRRNLGANVCEDIDECAEGTHMCDQYQNCLNTNGSHECHCKLGFQLDPILGACVDINECATRQHSCIPESQRCDNTVGSYICVRFIPCGTGYILHHSSNKCEDIDECSLGTHNCARAGPQFECVNFPGSFRCVRRATPSAVTTPQPEYEYYYDSEEDDDNSTSAQSPTPTTQKPKEIEQSPVTSTTPTASTRPTEIIPKPEVTQPTIQEVVPKHEDQYTTDDGFLPNIVNRIDGEDTDDNKENDRERDRGNENVSGIGHQNTKNNQDEDTRHKDDKTEKNNPEDRDNVPEKENIPDNKPVISTENTQEESPKIPKIVFIEPPKEIVPIKAVRTEDGAIVFEGKDLPKNTWMEPEGTPREICQAGFELDAFGGCVDIDECATNRHVCSGLTEVCRNNHGGYICECAEGFRRDLVTRACELLVTTTPKVPSSTVASEKNEWWRGTSAGRIPQKPFRARNLCDAGFHLNSQTGHCEDINECTNGIANCAAVEICTNTEGGYRCDCPPNWRFDEVRVRCVPVRNKSLFPTGYANMPGLERVNATKEPTSNVVLTPVEGPPQVEQESTREEGPEISCPWGFELTNENTCEDIDECSIGTATCGPTQICTNHPGRFSCTCPPGHELVGLECRDIDECAVPQSVPICSQNAECINTIGSYSCKCHQGFRSAPLNDKTCIDVDECGESRAGSLCQHRCHNVWGGYRCSCHKGYKLAADNRTCVDIDECSIPEKRVCAGRCINLAGSFRCACPSGYRLHDDKHSCIDIDECEDGTAPCASGSPTARPTDHCINTRGGYRCERISCQPGYVLENRHRCTKQEQRCAITDWKCLHEPNTYSYNFITFVSNLYIPDKLDLFTMRGPPWASAQFELRLVNVDAPPTVKKKADINSFLLTPTTKHAVVSIVESPQGPQTIELELSMELYSDDRFAGIAIAKLFIFVSEYDF